MNEKNEKLILIILMIVIATAVLCGCPQDKQLKCWLWNTDPNGIQTAVPISNFSEIEAPYGAYLHFEGGRIDPENSWVDYKINGRSESIRINLITNNPNNSKCAADVMVGLIAIAGYTIPAIIANDAQKQWFDIVVPMGPIVETSILKIKTIEGDNFVVLLYGEASDDINNPPADDAYRLILKLQGQGQVEVKRLDENGVPYSVGSVTTSAVFDVEAGTNVYFTAYPYNGWRFEKWLVNGKTGTSNPEAKVTMESDVELIAVFVPESAPVDTTPPVITILGANPVQLNVGSTWTDPGATAIDAVDGVCMVTVTGTVNTAIAGVYQITYFATDRSGNQASVTRTVVVVPENPPNPSTPIVGALSWNGSQLTASFTGVTSSSVFGFEIYHISGSAPWVEREVWNVSNGTTSGVVTKFRSSLNKTFRFENVTTASSGGYVDPSKVSWIGSYIPTRIADANGNVAWQITFP